MTFVVKISRTFYFFNFFQFFENDLTFDMLKKRRPGSQKRITGTDNVGKE